MTNNIAESIHSKINYYLLKDKITPNIFIYSLKNILTYNEIKINKIMYSLNS